MRGKGLRVRWTARVILLLWVLFWLWFAIADGIGSLKSLGAMGLLSQLAIVAAMVIVIMLAWFFDLFGGLLLIILAIAFYFFFHVPDNPTPSGGGFMLLVMVLPPLLAGVLLSANALTLWQASRAK
jgi:hypothetical protein